MRNCLLILSFLSFGFPNLSHGQAFSFQTISSGSFTMGCASPPDPVCDQTNWEQQHSVTISTSFEMTTTEVTQLQWYTVMGTNPSLFKTSTHCPSNHMVVGGVSLCPNRPVEKVSWNTAQTFIAALNSAAGLTCGGLPSDPSGCYRLPTEAEWEFAARAGTSATWSWGSNPPGLPTGSSFGWFVNNSGNKTQDVAQKSPNGNGLYDMHGNVAEWTYDWWQISPLPNATDPTGPATGTFKVFRGGNYASDVIYSASYDKSALQPTVGSYQMIGFRLVRNL